MNNVDENIPVYFKNFLTYTSVVRNRSKNTCKEYFYDIRMFLRYIELFKHSTWNYEDLENQNISKVLIDDIKSIDLQYLYDYMEFSKNHLNNSASCLARKVASLKSFYKYLTKKVKLLDNDVASEIESIKLKKRLPKYLDVSESINLLDCIDGEYQIRDFCIICVLLNTGMRLSELVSINLDEIKNETIKIVGKGDKERIISLNQASVNAINEYLKVRPNEGVKDKNALFLSERLTRISKRTVQHIVKKNIVASGLSKTKYSTHSTRHSFATMLHNQGVDIRTLQEILGHQSISSTEVYTHINTKTIKDAMKMNPLSKVKRT